jgi:hypothetical protein
MTSVADRASEGAGAALSEDGSSSARHRLWPATLTDEVDAAVPFVIRAAAGGGPMLGEPSCEGSPAKAAGMTGGDPAAACALASPITAALECALRGERATAAAVGATTPADVTFDAAG